jgi:transcriptional regulator with XRE-family HTH domain
MELNELINRIGYMRNRANLSARKLSLAVGKSAGYIHQLETARNFAPIFEIFVDILEACNTSIEEFFYYSIPAYQKDQELIELLKSTTSDRKELALQLQVK